MCRILTNVDVQNEMRQVTDALYEYVDITEVLSDQIFAFWEEFLRVTRIRMNNAD
jgi:hypothetical protein